MSIKAKEGGAARPIPETTEETPISKIGEREAFDAITGLRTEDREKLDAWQPVVKGGEPVVPGFVEGKEKATPEDVKVKDPENRLFAVFDGVSTGGRGALAARLAGKIVSERLGEDFEKELRAISSNERLSIDDRKDKIEIYAKVGIRNAIREAHEACERIPGGNTTASVVKLVEMPDGEKRMYFANVGDSRVFKQEKIEETYGPLKLLTKDDNKMKFRVDIGDLTETQAIHIDQAMPKDLLPDEQKLFRLRNQVTETVGSLGLEKKALSVFVEVRPIQAGDRIIITSDGVHDILRLEDMEKELPKVRDARLAERALQAKAKEKNYEPGYGRSKRSKDDPTYFDDTSAIVYEVPNSLPVREREEPKAERTERRALGWEDAKVWKEDLNGMSAEIFRLERMVEKIGVMGSVVIRKKILDQKIVAAELERNMRELELSLLRKEIPKSVRLERGSELEKKALAAKANQEFLDRFPVYLVGLQTQRKALEHSPMDLKTEDIDEAVKQARLQAHLRGR